MKITFTTLFAFVATLGYGQSAKAVEQDLMASFKRIIYWSDYTGSFENINKEDSLEKANDTFGEKLLKYTEGPLPAIDFRDLEKEGLWIARSGDGQLTIYSWDTWTGGTMHNFRNVYQYTTGNKVFSKTTSNAGGDPGCFYSNIYSITNAGHTYYLGVSNAIYSTKDAHQAINVFTISGNALNDSVKLIKTKTGVHNSLGFGFDFFSVVERPERPVKLINYDSTAKTIRIPVVLESGKVTPKWIVYRFTGNYFERSQ